MRSFCIHTHTHTPDDGVMLSSDSKAGNTLPPPRSPGVRVGGGKGELYLKSCVGVVVALVSVLGIGSAIAACGCTGDDVMERLLLLEESNRQLLDTVQTLKQMQVDTNITATTPHPQPPPATKTLSAQDLFQHCTTRIENRCTIAAGIPSGSRDFLGCSTRLAVVNRPREYVLNVQCLLIEETTDNNPLIATLDIVNNQGFCRCFAATLNAANRVTAPVTCGMQVTRCTVPTNITARIL